MKVFAITSAFLLGSTAALNFAVDAGNRWHGAPHFLSGPLKRGESKQLPLEFDDRKLRRNLIFWQPRPEVVMLGSSRVYSFPMAKLGAPESSLNLGVSLASYRDYLAIWQLLKENGKVPRRLIVGLDPWSLSPDSKTQNWKWREWAAEADRFQGKINTIFLQRWKTDAWNVRQLFSLGLALASMKKIWERSSPKVEPGTVFTRYMGADGAYFWTGTPEGPLPPVPPMDRDWFDHGKVDPEALKWLDALRLEARSLGTEVVYILPPVRSDLENWLRTDASLAPLRQSFGSLTGLSPECDGVFRESLHCTDSEFRDQTHPPMSCLEKFFARCSFRRP